MEDDSRLLILFGPRLARWTGLPSIILPYYEDLFVIHLPLLIFRYLWISLVAVLVFDQYHLVRYWPFFFALPSYLFMYQIIEHYLIMNYKMIFNIIRSRIALILPFFCPPAYDPAIPPYRPASEIV